MTRDEYARIIDASQWERLQCPACGKDDADTLLAREVRFYRLPLPLPAGRLRLDIQLGCSACAKLLRLRVYEGADDVFMRFEDDATEEVILSDEG
jgi:hypothetical protein